MSRQTRHISSLLFTRVCAASALVLIGALALGGTAYAAPPRPWKVGVVAPQYVYPGNNFRAFVNVRNTSGQPLTTEDVNVDITFPEGMSPQEPFFNEVGVNHECQTIGQVEHCELDRSSFKPDVRIRMELFAPTDPAAAGKKEGRVEVSGGGIGETPVVPFAVTYGHVPGFQIDSFDVSAVDGQSYPSDQAASTPAQVDSTFSLAAEAAKVLGDLELGEPESNAGLVNIAPPEHLRTVIAHVPAGLIGNPLASARCSTKEMGTPFETPDGSVIGVPNCPPGSQVGLAQLSSGDIRGLYNLVPPAGSPAAFGFFYFGVVVILEARIRPSDHGVDILARNAADTIPLAQTEVTFWGVPAASSHDRLRGTCIFGSSGFSAENPCPVDDERTAFLRNPTSCTGNPLSWGLEVNSWEHPETFVTKSTTTPAMQGCAAVPFDPSVSVEPSEHTARASSGLGFELSMPQSSDPEGLAEADLREAKVSLPKGVTINPASAEGLGACSDAQLGLEREGPAECPESSKIGTVDLISPLLDQPVGGSVYLRDQASRDPASGDLYRLAVELRSDERGVAIKLPGSLVADPATGQLTTVFKNLPQLPFETMQLHLKTGSRAPLTMPGSCGSYATKVELTSWSGKTVTFQPQFTINKGCDAPGFSPGFEAGVTNNAAGAYSPLLLRVTRDAGEPNLARITATLPEGELAKFAGVPLCPESGMQSGDCPAASKIGSVTAAIGEGAKPLFLPAPGKEPISVYVGGPYESAPYSVLTRVPAQAGPFDLGTVLVRSAVTVDPDTTQAKVISDPLPQIYGGIPVSYRDVRIGIDRPDFAINPTDCERTAVTGAISSATGQEVGVSDPFQVADCAALGFKPQLSLKLKGSVSRRAHPRLIATLHGRPGDANIARAQVKLPQPAFLDQSHIGTICTRVQFAAQSCPARSVYGRAYAVSPLLDYPLKGNVYLRSSSHPLPDLVADLRGPSTSPIEVALDGRVDSVKGALRNTFEAVPDAPVTSFRLELFGGKRGLIEMSDGFCSNSRATTRFVGQNGRVLDRRIEIKAKGCNAHKRGHHRRAAR